MSSTNHTTNYNLPQFVGSDKPAWLGDINPTFSAIDTAMHANATTAAQGVTDAATAQAKADSAYTKAGDAETAASTAQSTANTAISNTNTLGTRVNTIENRFNLNDIDKISDLPSASMGQWPTACNLTLAQNSDGSVFKFYGYYTHTNNSGGTITVQKSAVPGLANTYGIDTGLTLNTSPTSAYEVYPAGFNTAAANNSYVTGQNVWGSNFAVGTNGHIYIFTSGNNNEQTVNGVNRESYYYPSIYFSTNWGDTSPDISA